MVRAHSTGAAMRSKRLANCPDPRGALMARELITPVHMKLIALTLMLAASSALASVPQKLALPMGHTTTISMPSAVSKVTVGDPSKVEIHKQGRKVTLVALDKGTTEATIKTQDGVHKVSIYVAADKYAMPY
jgi:Flp pilus assembly secretin CpaC